MGVTEKSRLKDALEYLREAEKNTEKGWFRNPDWDIAAQYFEKAGQAFKAGKSYEQAIQALIKASDAMVSSTSLFMAGRAMEDAGGIAIQNLGQPERAADMYKRASDLFLQSMTPDRAAELLEKSAKAMEPISVDSAIESYIGACDIYENEDRARYAADTFKRTISLLVKHKRFAKAIEVLQRLGNVHKGASNNTAYYKTLLSIIIVELAAGDEVNAGARFQEYCSVEGFVQSEESAVAHAMLDAFENRDQDYYNQTAARQYVGFLDNEIARLARNIVISNDLISGAGCAEPGQALTPPQQHQQMYLPQGHSGSTPPVQSSPYQQQQPPYPAHPHQQLFSDQKDVYQAQPVSRNLSRPLSMNGGYEISPTSSSDPPPYSEERSESDWHALTEKQPYQQGSSYLEQRQQPEAPPSRNYYQDVEADDDGLL